MPSPYDEFRANFLAAQPAAPRTPIPNPQWAMQVTPHLAQTGRTQPVVNQEHLQYLAQQLITKTFPQMQGRKIAIEQMPALLGLAAEQGYQPQQPPQAQPLADANWQQMTGGFQTEDDKIRRYRMAMGARLASGVPWDPMKEPPLVAPQTLLSDATDAMRSAVVSGAPGETRYNPMVGAVTPQNLGGTAMAMQPGDSVGSVRIPKQTPFPADVTRPRVDPKIAVSPDDEGRAAMEAQQAAADAEYDRIQQGLTQARDNLNAASTGDEYEAANQALRKAEQDYREYMQEQADTSGSSLLINPLTVGLGLYDMGMKEVQGQLGQYAFNYQSQETIGVGDVARGALLGQVSSLLQETLTAGQIESFMSWAEDPANKDTIIRAYQNGYGAPTPIDTDGDGMPDATARPFYGEDAVWELYQSENTAWQKGVSDAATDPFAMAAAPAAGLAKTGREIAKQAAQEALETGTAPLARTMTAQAMQVPQNILSAADIPVDRLIGSIARGVQFFGMSDDAARSIQTAILEDLTETTKREFGASFPTSPATLPPPPGTAPMPPGPGPLPQGSVPLTPSSLSPGPVPPVLAQGLLGLPPGQSPPITADPWGSLSLPTSGIAPTGNRPPSPLSVTTDQPLTTERYVPVPPGAVAPPVAPQPPVTPVTPRNIEDLGVEDIPLPPDRPDVLPVMTRPERNQLLQEGTIEVSDAMRTDRRFVDWAGQRTETLRRESPNVAKRWDTARERIQRVRAKDPARASKFREPDGFFWRKQAKQTESYVSETVELAEAWVKNTSEKLPAGNYAVAKPVSFSDEGGLRFAMDRIVFGTDQQASDALAAMQRILKARGGKKTNLVQRDAAYTNQALTKAQQLRARFQATIDAQPQMELPPAQAAGVLPPAASTVPTVKTAVRQPGIEPTQPELPTPGTLQRQAMEPEVPVAALAAQPVAPDAAGIAEPLSLDPRMATPQRPASGPPAGRQFPTPEETGPQSRIPQLTEGMRPSDRRALDIQTYGDQEAYELGMFMSPANLRSGINALRKSIGDVMRAEDRGKYTASTQRVWHQSRQERFSGYIRAADERGIEVSPESRSLSNRMSDSSSIGIIDPNLQRLTQQVTEQTLRRGQDLRNVPEPALPNRPGRGDATYPDARIAQAARSGKVTGDEARMLAQQVFLKGNDGVERPTTLLDMILIQIDNGFDTQQAVQRIEDTLRAQELMVIDVYGNQSILVPSQVIPERGLTAEYAAYAARRILSAPSQLFREGVMYNLVSGGAATGRDSLSNSLHVAAVLDPVSGARVLREMPSVLKTYDPDTAVTRLADEFGDVREAIGLGRTNPYEHLEAFQRAGITGGRTPMLQRGAQWLAPTQTGKKVAKKVAAVFASEGIRNRRVGVDIVSRVVTGRSRLLSHTGDQRLRWLAATRDNLVRWGHSPEDVARFIDEFAHMGQRIDGELLFSAGDVMDGARRLGLTDGQAERLSRNWKEAIRQADGAAREDVSKALFSYKQTKVDNAVSQFLVFHYWQTRAIGNTARAIAKNPWLLRMGIEMQEYFDETSDLPGLPPWQRGMFKFMGDTGGWLAFLDPINVVVPYANFREMAKMNGDELGFDEIMEAAGIAPLTAAALTSLGWYQPFQAPNILGTNAPFQAITAISDLARNYILPEWFEETDYLGLSDSVNLPQEFFNNLAELTNQGAQAMAKFLGVEGVVNPVSFTNLGASRIVRTRQILTDLYMEQEGKTPEELTGDDYLAIAAILETEATGNPHPLLTEAYQQETFNLGIRRAVNMLSPLPILTTYGPQAERSAIMSGEMEANDAVRGAAFNINSMATAASPDFESQLLGSSEIGDPEAREMYELYNSLIYDDLDELSRKYGGAMGFQLADGTMVFVRELAAMTQDERQSLIDGALLAAERVDEMEQHRKDRDQFKTDNPEVARFWAWRDTYSDLNQEDMIKTRDQMMAANPAYKQYVNRLKPASRETFGALFSPDAYRVWNEQATTIYRDAESTSGGSVAASTDLLLSGMQDQLLRTGSGAGKTSGDKVVDLELKVREAEAAQTLYTTTVTGILGTSPDNLHPLWEEAAEQDPRISAIEKPYIPGDVKDYLWWKETTLAGDPNADVSVAAYLAWQEQIAA